MKAMIVGSRGMLGTDLMAESARRCPTLGADIEELDITDASRCRDLIGRHRPDAVINAAALTDVDYCESHEDEAFRVNSQGSANLAAAVSEIGGLMVYYSTDYVFDGAKAEPYQEEDRPHPLNVYGRSKLAGEEMVRSLCPEHLILRTSWLFGPHGRNFIRTILEAAAAQKSLEVVDDQRGSPTYTRDLAEHTFLMLEAGCRGTYHVTGGGSCTWYGLARSALAWAGMDAVSVVPVTSGQFPRPAARPANSVLSNGRLLRDGLTPMRHWSEAAEEYVRTALSAA